MSLDTICRNALTGNMTIQYTGTAVSEITVSVVALAIDFRRASAFLRGLAVLPFEDGCYHGLVHPNTSFDLQSDSNSASWIELNKYVSIEKVHEGALAGELGKMSNIRFQESQNIFQGVGAASAVTYHSWVFGKESFGAVDVANQGIQKIVHQPGDSGVADPLNLNGTIGWKCYAVYPILDSNRAVEVIGTSNG